MALQSANSHEAPIPEPGQNGQYAAEGSVQRLSARTLIIALLWLVGTVAGVLVLLQLFVERIPPLDETRLAAAEERWEENGPRNYDMDIVIGGARPGTVHVEVRNGNVVAQTRDGRVPKKHSWEYWSVPGLFGQLERELEMAEDPEHEMQVEANTRIELRCEFDAQYGYPRVFQRVVYGGGPPVDWRITRFEAR